MRPEKGQAITAWEVKFFRLNNFTTRWIMLLSLWKPLINSLRSWLRFKDYWKIYFLVLCGGTYIALWSSLLSIKNVDETRFAAEQ